MPSVVNGYCSTAHVRGQLSDAGQVLDEDLLVRAVNATSRAIDEYCSEGLPFGEGGRRFWRDASVTTRVYAADNPTRLWVDDFSTTTGLIVKTDAAGDGTFATTWTIGTDFQVEPLNGGVAAGGDTPAPYAYWEIVALGPTRWFPVYAQRAGAQVTTRFGWSALPDGVFQAAVLKSTSLFKRKDAPWGVAGFAEFGPVRITRADPDVIDLLRPYVKRRTRTLTYRPQAGSLFHRRGAGSAWPPW